MDNVTNTSKYITAESSQQRTPKKSRDYEQDDSRSEESPTKRFKNTKLIQLWVRFNIFFDAEEFNEPPVKLPISELDLSSKNFKIKCRLINKGTIRRCNEESKEDVDDYYLQFHFLDKDEGEISGVAFGLKNCQKFDELLKVKNVYDISKVKMAEVDSTWSFVVNEYQIIFTNLTVVEQLPNTHSIPSIVYNFKTFNNLDDFGHFDVLDLIGLVEDVGGFSDGIALIPGKMEEWKKHKYNKLDIRLIDETGIIVKVIIWDQNALKFLDYADETCIKCGKPCVVAFKGVKAKEFNDEITYNVNDMTIMTFNPEIPRAKKLVKWFEKTRSKNNV